MSAKDNQIFYNPVNIGIFDLGVTQLNKLLPFESLKGVVDASAKIDVFDRNNVLIRSFTDGDGFTISGTNVEGTLKSVDLILNGSEFVNWVGVTLLCKCTFYTVGDVEIIFGLKIVG